SSRRSSDDALPGDAAELLLEEPQQIDLGLVARREVGVTAFARGHAVLARFGVPEQHRLAEAGPGADDGDRAVLFLGAYLQRADGLRRQREHAVGGRLEIVEQPRVAQARMLRELPLVDVPRQVRRVAHAVDHGAGDAERSESRLLALPGAEELLDDGGQI